MVERVVVAMCGCIVVLLICLLHPRLIWGHVSTRAVLDLFAFPYHFEGALVDVDVGMR